LISLNIIVSITVPRHKDTSLHHKRVLLFYPKPLPDFFCKTHNSLHTFAKLVLMVHLFLGGASGFLELLLKTFILFIVVIAFGAIYGRFKTPQAVDFLLKVPTTIAVVGLILATWS